MTKRRFYRWLSRPGHAHPTRPAVTFWRPSSARDSITYTYGSLFDRVEQLGEQLSLQHVDQSSPLGLLLSTQEDQVLHYLAALSAGLVPAILTPPNPKLNRAYYQTTMTEVLRRCRFGALITDVDGVEADCHILEPYTLRSVTSPRQEILSAETPQPIPVDTSFIQFSSGTTGIKRGVLVSDEAVISQLETYADAVQLSDDDVIVSWLPLYHDMGFIACLNLPLAFGIHTVMMDPVTWVTNPGHYLQAVTEHRGTLSWHPNFAYAFMAERAHRDLEEVDLSSVRALVNCSEPATHESQQAFMDRFRRNGLTKDVFKGCYAMAETTFALTHGEPDDDGALDPEGPENASLPQSSAGYVSVGKLLPGVVMKVVNPDDWRELPDRVVGELWVKSPFNFSGYYNDNDATSAAIVDGWYRTGDLGYRAGDNYYIAGRHKDVMIVGGVNVFPQDLEDLVSEVEGVHPGRVAAFSVFDERMQTERVVVLAETEMQPAADSNAALVVIRQRILAAFQIANFVVKLVPPGWVIKSSSGKVARSANRDKWLQGEVTASRSS